MVYIEAIAGRDLALLIDLVSEERDLVSCGVDHLKVEHTAVEIGHLDDVEEDELLTHYARVAEELS